MKPSPLLLCGLAAWLALARPALRAQEPVFASELGRDSSNWAVQRGAEFAAATWTAAEDGAEGLVGLLEFDLGEGRGKMAGIESKGAGKAPALAAALSAPSLVRFWCRSSQPGRQVRVQIVDANDERFITPGKKTTGGLEAFEFPLSIFEAHWGGDNNGRPDFPLKMLAIQAVKHNTPTEAAPEQLWIKRLEIVE